MRRVPLSVAGPSAVALSLVIAGLFFFGGVHDDDVQCQPDGFDVGLCRDGAHFNGLAFADDITPDSAISSEPLPGPAPTGPRQIVLRIDQAFDGDDHAHILVAVGKWNEVLNGRIHLSVSTTAFLQPAAGRSIPRPSGWVIVRIDSDSAMLQGKAFRRTLALTVGFGSGGVIYIVSDRVGRRDLSGIVMHEIGHLLGAPHDADGRLMSPYYDGNKQECVDHPAAHAVERAQRLPVNSLNWCGPVNSDEG